MAIAAPIKRRHDRRRAVIKAHFAKKRAAAAKPVVKPALKATTTIIDAGHNPSEAKIKRLRSSFPKKHTATSSSPSYAVKDKVNVKKISAAIKPTPTPKSSSAAPVLKVPQADAHTGPIKAPATPGVGKAIAITAAGAGAAYAAYKVTSGGKKFETRPVHGELAVQRGAIASTKTPKVNAPIKKSFALPKTVHTQMGKYAAAVRERVGDPYAKNRASLDRFVGAFERADARKTPPTPPKAPATPAAPKPKAAITGSGPGKRRNADKKARMVAARQKKSAEAYEFGNKMDKLADKLKVPKAPKVATPSGLTAKQRTARIAHLEKKLAPPKTPKVKKAVTGSAVGKQRNEAKKAQFKASQTTKVVAPSGLTQTQRTARIANLEKQLGQTKHPTPKPSPAQVTGSQPKTNVDFKQPKTPDLPKTAKQGMSWETFRKARVAKTVAPKVPAAPKPVELTAPATVSESQKRRADKKFYNARDRKYRAQQATPDPRIPVTSTGEVTAQRAQAEADAVKLKQNKARMVDIETALKEGEYSKTPSTTINVNKKNAAALFGTTEKEISKVARKIATVKPSPEGAAQIKTAPKDVKAIHARMREIEADLAKVKVEAPPITTVRTGAQPITNIRAAIAGHEAGKKVYNVAELNKIEARIQGERRAAPRSESVDRRAPATLEVKAPSGKRLPMPKPEKRTAVSEVKLEQAKAAVTSKPAAPPKATKAEATRVTPPKTEAQRAAKSHEAYTARHTPPPKITSPAISPGLSVKNILKGGAKLGVAGAVLSSMFATSKGTASYFSTKGDKEKRVKTAIQAAVKEGGAVAVGVGAFSAAHKGADLLAKAGGKKALAGVAGRFALGKVVPPVAIAATVHDVSSSYGKAIGGIQDAKYVAAQEKKGSEAKYGTIAKATATRKRRKAKMSIDKAGKTLDKYK